MVHRYGKREIQEFKEETADPEKLYFFWASAVSAFVLPAASALLAEKMVAAGTLSRFLADVLHVSDP